MMTVEIKPYLLNRDPDKYRGHSFEYTLKHSSGASFSVINLGALITNIMVPDRWGQLADVELGHKDLDDYLLNPSWHGITVGRSANRIKGATFEIEGVRHHITQNEGENNLHSGSPGFHDSFWSAGVLSESEGQAFMDRTMINTKQVIEGESVLFELVSPDGAAGFPGNLNAQVFYAWGKDKTLIIVFTGESDQATVFAPTNHSYFNLEAHDAGNVKNHLLWIKASRITRKSEDNVPDGTYIDVAGTPFDFTKPDYVGKTMNDSHPQLACSKGMDQNYCLENRGRADIPSAYLYDPKTGRKMEMLTNFPGVQIYTGNHLSECPSKNDGTYEAYTGICLEAQMYPDAVNHPDFPNAVIVAGERKCYFTGYRFSVENCL